MFYIYASQYLAYAFKLKISILQFWEIFFMTSLIIPSIYSPCSLYLPQRLYLFQVSSNYLSLPAVGPLS